MSRSTNKPKGKPAAQSARFSPIWLIGGGVVLLLLALFAADVGGIRSSLTGSDGTPRLQSDKQTIDLGDVKFEVPVSASFTLTNTGDGPLQFKEVPYVELVEGC
jgi:hypothetical protein